MNFEEMIKSLYPELNDQMSSKQYELSERILKSKIENNYNQSQMAKLMEVNFTKYIQMEMAETTISVEEYEQALRKFEENSVLAHQLISNTREVVRYPRYIFQDEELSLQESSAEVYLNVNPTSNIPTSYKLVEDVYSINYKEILSGLNWYEKVSKHIAPIYSKEIEAKLNVTKHMNHVNFNSYGNLVSFTDVEVGVEETGLLVVNV